MHAIATIVTRGGANEHEADVKAKALGKKGTKIETKTLCPLRLRIPVFLRTNSTYGPPRVGGRGDDFHNKLSY